MFRHIYINRLKCLLRDKQLVFWTILYPLLLATLFSLAFSNIMAHDKFASIPVDVVENEEMKNHAEFKTALGFAAGAGSDGNLLNVTYATQAQADEDLKNNKITGYIVFDNGPKVVVKDNGLNQTILKQFMDSYMQYGSAVTRVATANPQAIQNFSFGSNQNYFKEYTPGRTSQPDPMVIYYYALIGMAALFGGFWGVKEITDIQANLSAQGARLNLAPVHKLKAFGASFPAAVTVQFGALLILLAYLALALKIDFGNQLPFIILTCLIGSITGVTFGAMISVLCKKEALQMSLLIGSSMIFSFLAGMMAPGIRYEVTHAVPFLAYINPAHLISDSFYALYYYTGYEKFFLSIGLLAAYSIVFYLVVYFVTRRQRYASL